MASQRIDNEFALRTLSRCVHETKMPSLKSLLIRLTLQFPRYRSIYQRFSKYTMISQSAYVRNLALVHTFSHVPGMVVECGVWRGGMIAGIATLLGSDREYHLFDSFEGLPPARAIDGQSAIAWQADKSSPGYYDNCSANESEATAAMELSGTRQFALHKGWFDKTIPSWSQSAAPIAVLRLDGDWYDSTMVCLNHLMPKLTPGGIVIVDDYYGWDGCTKAMHEYLAASAKPLRMRQFLHGVFYIVNE
jgi:O-methyltransferase